MAPKKKGKTNGYYYLLMELRNRMDPQSADREAGRLWPNMTPAEKEPYIQKAQKARDTTIKMTTLQEPINHIQNREEEEKRQVLNMQDDIKSHIRLLRDTDTITTEYFHIMHVNTFFKTSYNVYFPAEIGLVRFNLRDGVLQENVYNTLIKPGKFPMGYLSIAKTQSETTHKISYYNIEDCNLEEVCENVFTFLQKSANASSDPRKLPAIYVKDDFKNLVANTVLQLASDYGYDPDSLRFYNLSFLLYTLRNDISNTNVWPSISQSLNELDTDVFDCATEIQCEYHMQIENPVHCSRAHVIRMAYIICDNCCDDLGIELIPGVHVPIDATVSKPLPSSAASTQMFSDRTESCAASTIQSYRTNLDTYVHDDKSTIVDPQDLEWHEVRSHRSTRNDFDQASASSNPRLPKTDWRTTEFGKGRGRCISTKK